MWASPLQSCWKRWTRQNRAFWFLTNFTSWTAGTTMGQTATTRISWTPCSSSPGSAGDGWPLSWWATRNPPWRSSASTKAWRRAFPTTSEWRNTPATSFTPFSAKRPRTSDSPPNWRRGCPPSSKAGTIPAGARRRNGPTSAQWKMNFSTPCGQPG